MHATTFYLATNPRSDIKEYYMIEFGQKQKLDPETAKEVAEHLGQVGRIIEHCLGESIIGFVCQVVREPSDPEPGWSITLRVDTHEPPISNMNSITKH